jgi:signal transduction histidine kinase
MSMLFRSLRFRLLALWFVLLMSAGATAFLLVSFFKETASAQVDRAEERTAQSCRAIAERYAFYSSGWRGPGPEGFTPEIRTQLAQVVQAALSDAISVEGGIWQTAAGSLAYAYPTYEGSGPKTDLPVAEYKSIQQVNSTASADGRFTTTTRPGNSQVLVLQACPLPGPVSGLTGWTMTRVYTGASEGYRRLVTGLGVLAVTVLGSAIWLGWVLVAWSRRIGEIEVALGGDTGGALPTLALTGEPEFDRLIEALNASGERLREAQRRITSAERLAAVGRLTAGIAHEIRNPIAAMRLKAENALASDNDSRRLPALHFVLDQIARLDQLLRDLLSMTQRRKPELESVDIASFLNAVDEEYRELAASKNLGLAVRIADDVSLSPDPPSFDRNQVRRAVSNLVANAIENTEPSGAISIEAARVEGWLHLSVLDTGSGVPAEIEDTLFEPFVTSRSEGTGLGLAIVREIARAHGGEARHLPTPTGAHFRIELPWRG